MSEEVLIPKMTRIDKTKRRKIKIPMLNVVIILFCTLLLIASTFVNIEIRHYIVPFGLFSNKDLTPDDFIYTFSLIPQIPTLMFICSTLGKRMALTSTIIYILIGLFVFPVFALGGGFRYIAQYGFGYIIAYIPAVLVAGKFLENKYSFGNMIKATLTGVLTIHIVGIFYMIFVVLIKHSGASFISGWINAQSGLKIVYDLIASFVLILIGKYLHSGLKYIIE